MSSNKKELYKVASRGFTSQNLLNINAYVQLKNKDGSEILSDIIYFEVSKGVRNENSRGFIYDTDNKISMKFNSYELRALCFALRTLHSKKVCNYKKYSDPVLSGSQGNKKEITLAFSKNNDESDKFYINFEEKNVLQVGIAFDTYELPAFVGSIEKIANEVDERLYSYQRALDKRLREQSNWF